MELKLLNEQGQASATLQASDALFGREYNEALIHQVVVAYMANARSGNRAQKGRDEVSHTTHKPWRQKGTGRARSGMSSSRFGVEAVVPSRTSRKRTSPRRLTARCTAPVSLVRFPKVLVTKGALAKMEEAWQ